MNVHIYPAPIKFSGRNLILLMAFFLSMDAFLFAQETESLYFNELKKGSTILAITNRVENPESSGPRYVNEVRDDGLLDFLNITLIDIDSLGVVRMDTSGFISAMRGNANDWLLFVHGDSKTFQQAVMRGFDIQHLYNVNVVVFSWPSRDVDVNGLKNFRISSENVVSSGEGFIELLKFMKRVRRALDEISPDIRLSVFNHSLGNYFIKRLPPELAEDHGMKGLFDNLVLNAAAVNQENHKQWVEELNFQQRIYITSNRKDFNLKGLHIFTNEGAQLGEKIKGPMAANACYINFSEAVGFRFPTGTTHTYFIGEIPDESMNIKTFYREILHGREAALDDEDMFREREDSSGYDILF